MRVRESTPIDDALIEVCRRALDKAPGHRYASIADLAQDIERWLGDEPVSVYREPIRKRVNRWMRKNQPLFWGAGTGAVVLVVTIVAALGFGYQAVKHEQQRTQAALAAESRRRELTRDVLNTLSESLIDDWLLEQPTLTVAQTRFIRRALSAYEIFVAETGNDPESVEGLAMMLQRIGGIQATLGQTDIAIESLERCRNLNAQIYQSKPEVVVYRYATVLRSLATQQRIRGDWQDAETNLQQSIELLLPLSNTPTQQDVGFEPQKEQENFRAIMGVAWTQFGLARLDAVQKSHESAEKHFAAAFETISELDQDSSTVENFRLTVLIARAWNVQYLESESERAKAYLEEAVTLSRDLVKNRPIYKRRNLSNLATALNDLGVLHRRNKRFDSAMKLYLEAKEIRESVYQQAPGSLDYGTSLGGSYGNIGNLLRIQGKLDEAMEEYDKAKNVIREGRYRARWYRRNALEGRAQVFIARKQWKQAFDELAAALKLNARESVGHDPTPYLRCMLLQAYAFAHMEGGEEALRVVSDTRRIPEDSDYGLYCYHAARILAVAAERDSADDSEKIVEKAVQLLNKAVETDFDYEDEIGRGWREDPAFAKLRQHVAFRPPADEPSPPSEAP